MIQDKLIRQEAEKRGVAANDEFRKELELARQSLLIRALFRDYNKKNPVTDAEIQKEYDRAKAQTGDREYRARHILVATEADAKTVLADLKKQKAPTSVQV